VHRRGVRDVGDDLVDHPSLRAGQGERERRIEALDQRPARPVREPPRLLGGLQFPCDQHHLHAQHLVEGETAPGRVPGLHRVGQMDVVQRAAAREQTEPLRDVRRDGVGDAPGLAAHEGALDPLCEVPRADA